MKQVNKREEWYAQKTQWNDEYMGSDRLPKWIIKRVDETLNEDQLKWTELNVVCKIQGTDAHAQMFKDMILKAINNQ